jgi:hypothetical protein
MHHWKRSLVLDHQKAIEIFMMHNILYMDQSVIFASQKDRAIVIG